MLALIKPYLMLLTVSVSVATSCLNGAEEAGPSASTVDPTERLVRDVVDAGTVDDAARGLRKLFDLPSRKLLRRLKASPHHGIAIRAAWEEVLLEGRNQHIRQDGEDRRPIHLAKFIGFIEGRLKVAVPEFWEHSAMHRLRPGAAFVPLEDLTHEVRFGTDTLTVPRGQAFQRINEVIHFRHGNQSAVVSADVRQFAHGSFYASGLIDAGSCYLAFPPMGPYSYSIFGTDQNTGRKNWEARVWSAGWSGGTTGRWHNFTGVLSSSEGVLVFGEATLCFYIEGFDPKSGKCLFRFANRYAAE